MVIKQLLAVALFLLTISQASAQVPVQKVNKILTLSGLTRQVAYFPEALKFGMAQQANKLPPTLFAAMVRTVDTHFMPSLILAGVRTELARNLTREEAVFLFDWFNSDLGRTIAMEEEFSSSPDALIEIREQADTLARDQERMAFAKRLDKILGSTDLALKVQEKTIVTAYSAIRSVLDEGQAPPAAEFRKQVSEQLTRNRQDMARFVWISTVHSYQTIALEDLDRYEIFLRAPATQKFSRLVNDNLIEGLEKAMSAWAKELALVIRQHQATNPAAPAQEN